MNNLLLIFMSLCMFVTPLDWNPTMQESKEVPIVEQELPKEDTTSKRTSSSNSWSSSSNKVEDEPQDPKKEILGPPSILEESIDEEGYIHHLIRQGPEVISDIIIGRLPEYEDLQEEQSHEKSEPLFVLEEHESPQKENGADFNGEEEKAPEVILELELTSENKS